MKKLLMFVGAVTLFGFVALIIAGTFAFIALNKLNKEAEAYVETTLLDVASEWSTDTFLEYAAPELLENTAEGALEKTLSDASRQIGRIEEIIDLNCQTFSNASISEGKSTTSDCLARATHERGEGEFKIKVSKQDGIWLLSGFFITYFPAENAPTEI